MITRTDSGLAVYGSTTDLAGSTVRVRRCVGIPPRVVIETTSNPPELDPTQARAIAEALLQFCRRVAVHDDAGLPKKQITV